MFLFVKSTKDSPLDLYVYARFNKKPNFKNDTNNFPPVLSGTYFIMKSLTCGILTYE